MTEEATPEERMSLAVRLLDQAQELVQDAIGDTDAGYGFVTQISNLATALEEYEFIDEEDTRTIELTVRVKIRGSADVQDVVSNCNYDFAHEDIVETEIVDVNTEV